jgi:hypothetical protein|tara:strand:- start:1816 stop:3081 length:1266 start_codon:yes stop_codon:yes gene_type:complete
MATSSQIKSAIRSRGAAQREITQQLAGVSEQLLKAEESARLNEFRAKEEAVGFASAFSALEAGSTYLEGVKQSQELKSNIDAFEQFLPESVRQSGGVTIERGAKSSLMDVFTGTSSMSDYLYGKETYMLGERKLGSKYDVSAMGEKAKAMQQGDLLDQFFGGEPLAKSKVSRELGIERPSIDITKLYGGLKEKPSMMDKVGDKIKEGTLVQSDGSVVPEKILEKAKMSAEDYLKTDPPNAIKEMIKPSYLRSEDVPSSMSKDVTDYENEKLVNFLPEFLQSTEKDMLEPIAQTKITKGDNFKERAANYTFEEPKTFTRSPLIGAKKLKQKIKDLKVAEENLKGLRPEDTFNRKKFGKLVEKRTSELQSIISQIYNPNLDILYGDSGIRGTGGGLTDAYKGKTLRSELDSDSLKFIKQFSSR